MLKAPIIHSRWICSSDCCDYLVRYAHQKARNKKVNDHILNLIDKAVGGKPETSDVRRRLFARASMSLGDRHRAPSKREDLHFMVRPYGTCAKL